MGAHAEPRKGHAEGARDAPRPGMLARLARPRTRRGELLLWGALLAGSLLLLLPSRPFAAWRYDLTLLDVARRRLAAHALRAAPDDEVLPSLLALHITQSEDDGELTAIAARSRVLLAERAADRIAQRALTSGRAFEHEVAELVRGREEELAVALVHGLAGSSRPESRARALLALAHLDPEGAGDLALAERLAADPDPGVRLAALRALYVLAPSSPRTFGRAQIAVQDEDAAVRNVAWRIVLSSPHMLERARDPERAQEIARMLAEAGVLDRAPAELRALLEPR